MLLGPNKNAGSQGKSKLTRSDAPTVQLLQVQRLSFTQFQRKLLQHLARYLAKILWQKVKEEHLVAKYAKSKTKRQIE